MGEREKGGVRIIENKKNNQNNQKDQRQYKKIIKEMKKVFKKNVSKKIA